MKLNVAHSFIKSNIKSPNQTAGGSELTGQIGFVDSSQRPSHGTKLKT